MEPIEIIVIGIVIVFILVLIIARVLGAMKAKTKEDKLDEVRDMLCYAPIPQILIVGAIVGACNVHSQYWLIPGIIGLALRLFGGSSGGSSGA